MSFRLHGSGPLHSAGRSRRFPSTALNIGLDLVLRLFHICLQCFSSERRSEIFIPVMSESQLSSRDSLADSRLSWHTVRLFEFDRLLLPLGRSRCHSDFRHVSVGRQAVHV